MRLPSITNEPIVFPITDYPPDVDWDNAVAHAAIIAPGAGKKLGETEPASGDWAPAEIVTIDGVRHVQVTISGRANGTYDVWGRVTAGASQPARPVVRLTIT